MAQKYSRWNQKLQKVTKQKELYTLRKTKKFLETHNKLKNEEIVEDIP